MDFEHGKQLFILNVIFNGSLLLCLTKQFLVEDLSEI